MNGVVPLSSTSIMHSFYELDDEQVLNNHERLILLIGLAAIGLIAAGWLYIEFLWRKKFKAENYEKKTPPLKPSFVDKQHPLAKKSQNIHRKTDLEAASEAGFILEEFRKNILFLPEREFTCAKPFRISLFFVLSSDSKIQSISTFILELKNKNDASGWLEFQDQAQNFDKDEFRLQKEHMNNLPDFVQVYFHIILTELNQAIKDIKREAGKVPNQREWIKEHMLKRGVGQLPRNNQEAILNQCIDIAMKKPFWINFFINEKIHKPVQ